MLTLSLSHRGAVLGATLAFVAATACGASTTSRRNPDDDAGADASAGGAGGNGTSTGGTSAGGPSAGGAGGGTGDGGGDASADASAPGDGGDTEAGLSDGGRADASPPDAGSPDGAITPVTVLSLDFEGTTPANMDVGGGTLTPSQGFAPLGPEGNQFGPTFLRSTTGNTVTITFSALPAHTSISVDFLFAAIDSLDGTGSFPAGDFFRIDLDGQAIFRESFANATDSQIQSYVPPPGVELARRVDLGFSGPGSFYTDSAYDLGADPAFDDIPHTASSAVLTFTLEGAGAQDINDESWAIDNLRVTTGDTPRLRDGGSL
ncbi:MAG: hypothetical protein FJ104_11340 [Deltaproteobacteria bacterium]|nr:hypothetical protein [Deltaproteobacteria bacterium]